MFRTVNNRITITSSTCCCIRSADQSVQSMAFHIAADLSSISEFSKRHCILMSMVKPNFWKMICALLILAATVEGFFRHVPKRASIVLIRQPSPSLPPHSNHLYSTIAGKINISYPRREFHYQSAYKWFKARQCTNKLNS